MRPTVYHHVDDVARGNGTLVRNSNLAVILARRRAGLRCACVRNACAAAAHGLRLEGGGNRERHGAACARNSKSANERRAALAFSRCRAMAMAGRLERGSNEAARLLVVDM